MAPAALPEAAPAAAPAAALAALKADAQIKTSSEKVHYLREKFNHLRGEGGQLEAGTSAVPETAPVLAEVQPATACAATQPPVSANSEPVSKEQERRLLKSCKAVHEIWRLEAKKRKLEAKGGMLTEDEAKTLEREADALKAFREQLEALPAGSDLRPKNLDNKPEMGGETSSTSLRTSPRMPPGSFTTEEGPARRLAAELKELLGDSTMMVHELASAYAINHGKTVAQHLKEICVGSIYKAHHSFRDFLGQMTDLFDLVGSGNSNVRAAGGSATPAPVAAAGDAQLPTPTPVKLSEDSLKEARRQAEAELDEAWREAQETRVPRPEASKGARDAIAQAPCADSRPPIEAAPAAGGRADCLGGACQYGSDYQCGWQ